MLGQLPSRASAFGSINTAPPPQPLVPPADLPDAVTAWVLQVGTQKRSALESHLRMRSAGRDEPLSWSLLLHAALYMGAPAPVVDALLTRPPGVQEHAQRRGCDRELPLFMACVGASPPAIVSTLLAAYPEAAREVRGAQGLASLAGCLPLHAACKAGSAASPDVIALLLAAYPEAAGVHSGLATGRRSFNGQGTSATGPLPLHCACATSGTPPEVVELLLAANPGAAATACANGSSLAVSDRELQLPLLQACHAGAPARTISMILAAHPAAAGQRGPTHGETPLLALCAAPPVAAEAVAALLAAAPHAAREKFTPPPPEVGKHTFLLQALDGLLGALPLHAAVRSQAPPEVIDLLLKAFPEGAGEADESGKLPLHFACAAVPFVPNAAQATIPMLLHSFPQAARVPYGRAHEPPPHLKHRSLPPVFLGGTEGCLPLHVACAQMAPLDALAPLLAVHPEGVMLPAPGSQLLPLQIALEVGAPADVLLALLSAHPAAARAWHGVGPKQEGEGGGGSGGGGWLARGGGGGFGGASSFYLPSGASQASLSARALGTTAFAGCLPLHAACLLRAPPAVLAALVRAFPEAAGTASRDGRLPLHLACESGLGLESMAALLEAHPLAARTPTQSHFMEWSVQGSKSANASDGCSSSAGSGSGAGYSFPGHPVWLPLEVACSCGVPAAAAAALVSAYPEAAHSGAALRGACLFKAPLDLVLVLLAAHPPAASQPAANGKLPLHFACAPNPNTPPPGTTRTHVSKAGSREPAPIEAVVAALLQAHPCGARTADLAGALPLHIACTSAASSAVVGALLGAYPLGARQELPPPSPRTQDHGCWQLHRDTTPSPLPLHLAFISHAPASTLSALLAEFPQAAHVRLRQGAQSLLHAACADELTGGDSVAAILRASPPEAAQEVYDGNLPLHCACARGASGEAIPALVAAFPEAVHVRGKGGTLPLALLKSSSSCPPPLAVAALLVALTEGSATATTATTTSGSGSSSSGGGGGAVPCTEALVDFLLVDGEQLVPHAEALMDALGPRLALAARTPTAAGRTPLGVAGPLCRAALHRRLFVCGRYELRECVHHSATSRVDFALDHGGGAGSSVPGAAAAAAATTVAALGPAAVALKFLRHKEHFDAELRARERAAASASGSASGGGGADFLLPVLASYAADTDVGFARELAAREQLAGHGWLLVMPAGDRSLEDVVVHESAAPGWQAEAARACREVARALASLHGAGLMHGDVKPRNVLRLGRHYRLIDFDAAAPLGTQRSGSGKLSTAFAPPEAFALASSSSSAGLQGGGSSSVSRAVGATASPAVDAWGLGATLFRLLQCATLVHATDADDARGEAELRALASWSEGSTKAAALSTVADARARNLLSQLLHADPSKRPSMARVLQHPFLTGREALRLHSEGAPAVWDVFLSYRVASDAALAEALHGALTARGLRVFWDKKCLLDGQPWREGFFNGLVQSRAFLPIASRGALKATGGGGGNWETLTADMRAVDNVLLEWRAALECFDRGLLEVVLPLFVGDHAGAAAGQAPGVRGAYFAGGCAPLSADVCVAAVEAELALQLDRTGLGTPYRTGVTARDVFSGIAAFQGKFLEGETCAETLVGDALCSALGASAAAVAGAQLQGAVWEAHSDGERVWFVSPGGKSATWKLPPGARLAPPRFPPPGGEG